MLASVMKMFSLENLFPSSQVLSRRTSQTISAGASTAIILDCGGKRSATPLLTAPTIQKRRRASLAGAVQSARDLTQIISH